MNVLLWIGIAVAGWFALSVVAGFALAAAIGRGWTRAPRRRSVGGFGLVSRLDS